MTPYAPYFGVTSMTSRVPSTINHRVFYKQTTGNAIGAGMHASWEWWVAHKFVLLPQFGLMWPRAALSQKDNWQMLSSYTLPPSPFGLTYSNRGTKFTTVQSSTQNETKAHQETKPQVCSKPASRKTRQICVLPIILMAAELPVSP